MLNQHKGRRHYEKTGKEYMPKEKKLEVTCKSKKANKKYRCRTCNVKLPIYALVEKTADKHGRAFICYQCLKLSEEATKYLDKSQD